MEADVITLKEFFMWMTIINLILYLWSMVTCCTARSLIHRMHGKLFGLTPETIDAVIYGYFGLYKVVFVVFILAPWIALLIIS